MTLDAPFNELREALSRKQNDIPRYRKDCRKYCERHLLIPLRVFNEHNEFIDIDSECSSAYSPHPTIKVHIGPAPKTDPPTLFEHVVSSTTAVSEWLAEEADFHFPPDSHLNWFNTNLSSQLRNMLENVMIAMPRGQKRHKAHPENLHLTMRLMLPYYTFTFIIATLLKHEQFSMAHKLLTDYYTYNENNWSLLAFATPELLHGKHGHEKEIKDFLQFLVEKEPSLIEADLLIYTFCCLNGSRFKKEGSHRLWKPLLYRSHAGDVTKNLNHVVRVETGEGLDNICELLGLERPDSKPARDELCDLVMKNLNKHANDRNVDIEKLTKKLRLKKWGCRDRGIEEQLLDRIKSRKTQNSGADVRQRFSHQRRSYHARH